MEISKSTPTESKNPQNSKNHGPSIKACKTEDQSRPRRPPPPSILSRPEKIQSIIILTTMTFLGPASMSIYFPILGSLERDLHVSPSRITLTITIYMIAQALFPLLTAVFSDRHGRRPVFIICLTVSVGANIGLALQSTFAALMALRCLQSFGSSSLAVVGIATVTDILNRAERSKYRIYTSSGYTLASILGPVTGGLLAQFLGWRSVFWFLAMFAGVMLLLVLVCLRESCREVVRDGSVRPQRWNRALIDWLRPLAYLHDHPPPPESTRRPAHGKKKLRHGQGILDPIRLLGSWQTGLVVAFQAILFCGTMALFASIPLLFHRNYAFQPWQVGLTYVPYAAGGFAARWIVSPLTARNLQRYRHRLGADLMDHLPREFPFERARLQVILPLVYLAGVWVAVYSWLMQRRVHVAGPIVILFCAGNAITGANVGLTGLLLGIHRRSPAMALAAANLARFLCGAGAVAVIIPGIERIGMGWMGTIVTGVYLVGSGLLWVVYYQGQRWRRG